MMDSFYVVKYRVADPDGAEPDPTLYPDLDPICFHPYKNHDKYN